jgi:hypothetical protein
MWIIIGCKIKIPHSIINIYYEYQLLGNSNNLKIKNPLFLILFLVKMTWDTKWNDHRSTLNRSQVQKFINNSY